jgi:hypothetical protein
MRKKLPKLANMPVLMRQKAAVMQIMAAFLLLILGVAASATSAIAATKNYGLTSFDTVDVQGAYQISITLGTAVSAQAEGSQAALDSLEMLVIGNRLVIRERQNGAAQVRRDGRGPVKIYLKAAANLKSVNLSGSGSVAVNGLAGTKIQFALNGSGQIAASIKKADQIQLLVEGSGSVSLTGVARSMTTEFSGTGVIDASALLVRQLELRQSGAGNSRYTISEFATISASGMGNIEIAGRGLCRIQKDSGANIQCAGKVLPAK